jgi:hypothetical protein
MILSVRPGFLPLDHAGDAVAALFGTALLNYFDDCEPVHYPPIKAIEVTCDTSQGPYAKAGFVAAGFRVPTATGPAHAPATKNPVTLTVTPSLPDTFKNYPLGASESGMIAAKTLRGAFVTLAIGSNDDPYDGDPGTSMQVRCNQADIDRVKGGFGAAKFTAVQARPYKPKRATDRRDALRRQLKPWTTNIQKRVIQEVTKKRAK